MPEYPPHHASVFSGVVSTDDIARCPKLHDLTFTQCAKTSKDQSQLSYCVFRRGEPGHQLQLGQGCSLHWMNIYYFGAQAEEFPLQPDNIQSSIISIFLSW
jgi:hypothetical protein